MLNLSSVMIGTMQIEKMAKFYQEVLGREADMKQGGWYGWSVGNAYFSVGEHSEMSGKSKDSGRVIFNFETKELQVDFDRIKDIEGVEVVKEPYDPGENTEMLIATFADPDGNYFQLMTPWEE